MNEPKVESSMRPRVLVVEDEPDLREAMVSYLNSEGMQSDGVASLSGVQAWLQSHAWDLLVLDLGLPDGDGLEWLQQMQGLETKGVIIMTARGKSEQRIAGMRAGADAYLVKPVALEELALCLRKLYRRIKGATAQTPVWQLQSKRWLITGPDGRSTLLSQAETRLLQALGEANGDALPKATCIRMLGHDPSVYDDRRLEGLVRRVRQKCQEDLGQPLPLQTVYGFGYAFIETMQVLN